MTYCCNGTGISSSLPVATGKAHLLQQGRIKSAPGWIAKSQINDEIQRYRDAVDLAQQHLKNLRKQISSTTSEEIVEFVDAHLLMMQDHAFTTSVEELIITQACTADWGLQQQCNNLIAVFEAMEDTYLRTRSDDVEHVVGLIQQHLVKSHQDTPNNDLKGRVVVAQDLSPAEIIALRQQGVCAFVTEFGSPMSHSAILARSMDIPAIVGAHHITQLCENDETLVIDSLNGIVTGTEDPLLLKQFEQIIKANVGHGRQLRELLNKPTVSRDEQAFCLMANIELPEDIAVARQNGASAVGLYRTEFLYMNRDSPPSEEEQFAAYCEIIKQLDGLPLTIRTLDLGADKTTSYHFSDAVNPALGLRAIRLCLREPELFATQLRAIIRASATGPVRLMLPMLTHTREVDQARALINKLQQVMRVEGIPFDRNMPIGGMMEVPAAALAATSFARRLDFLSIGTNDLIQYTLATDRIDEEVAHLYDPLHPSILKLIANVIKAGRQQQIPVSMCGEMAGDPRFIPLLAGMGLREFSMQPNALLSAREKLLSQDFGTLKLQANQLLKAFDDDDEPSQLEKLLQIINQTRHH